jgi:hypothetical protein
MLFCFACAAALLVKVRVKTREDVLAKIRGRVLEMLV